MQAYEIDLKDYIVPGTEEQQRVDEKGQLMFEEEEPIMGQNYPTKQNLVNIFMAKPVTGSLVLKVNRLGTKILDCTEGRIHLDKAEYHMLKAAFEKFDGFRPRIDGILAERVLEATQATMVPE